MEKIKRYTWLLVVAMLVLAASPVQFSGFAVSAETPGVGEGIRWPAQVFAPYVDMVAWVSPELDYSISGVPNLGRIVENSGVEFFKLGFIQSVPGPGGRGRIEDGRVVWGWGGHEVLSPLHPYNSQYMGIREAIRDVRELGGDVAISIGGLYGITPWEVTQDVDVLVATYLEIIATYGLTRLDLDIETATSTVYELNVANARAIRQVQEETGIEIVLTLPVLPSGLTPRDQAVLRAYLSEGVDVLVVNVMTMAFGHATIPYGHNYGTASLLAVENTMRQVQDFFYRYAGTVLTDEEAFLRVGTTISIGFESAAHPIFTLEWAELVVEHAIENNLGLASFWSMNRDVMLMPNTGINAPYEFTNVFNRFADAFWDETYYDEDENGYEDENGDEDDPDPTPSPSPSPSPSQRPGHRHGHGHGHGPSPSPSPAPQAPDGAIEFHFTVGTVWPVGQLVSWNGQTWRVLQTFTFWGDSNWQPGIAPSLWVLVP